MVAQLCDLIVRIKSDSLDSLKHLLSSAFSHPRIRVSMLLLGDEKRGEKAVEREEVERGKKGRSKKGQWTTRGRSTPKITRSGRDIKLVFKKVLFYILL